MTKSERKNLARKFAALRIKHDHVFEEYTADTIWDALYEFMPDDWDTDMCDANADGSFEIRIDATSCTYKFKVSANGKVKSEKVHYWDMTPDPEERHWAALATHNERFTH